MKTKILLTAILMIGTMDLFCQVIHVPDDQLTIQAGIDVATNGDTVLVAQGTYDENINFNGKAITVASHYLIEPDSVYINNTIIDGSQPTNPDFGSVVTFLTGEDTTSIICGFTITNGTGLYLDAYDARIGGGIVCYYASAKIIHNNIINNETNSITYAWGGGIASINYTSIFWTIVENNIISNNNSISDLDIVSGGGIEIWGNTRIYNNKIKNNHCISISGNGNGGGIYVESAGSPANSLVLINNVVQNNTVETNGLSRGGGIYVRESHTVISNNDISYNILEGNDALGGGLMIHETASAEITDNIISFDTIKNTTNSWWGAGFNCGKPLGKTIIRNNEFSYNSSNPLTDHGAGGGLCVQQAWDIEVVVDANEFLNNMAKHGGGFYEKNSYNVRLTNNIFSENTAIVRGGAIGIFHPETKLKLFTKSLKENQPCVINNTIISNTSLNDGGGLRFDGYQRPPIIFNCIFWNNEAPDGKDIKNFSSLPLVVSYSDLDTNMIVGLWTGVGNIDEDPLLLDPQNGDFHISENSPCAASGIDSLYVNESIFCCPSLDFENDPRPWPFTLMPDIGADEIDEVNPGYPDFKETNNHTLILNNYPNPFRDQTTIEFTLPREERVTLKVFDLTGREIET
ncbi:MAG: hypothetical protein K8R86_07110, partial [Bacteroidales bacterium]|nr:hypothetical protein [Bacteroidales bacterium]